MGITGIVSLLIIGATCWISYRGFKNTNFYAGLEFEVEKILLYRDYKRLITSGFVHVNWMHLVFNLVSLLFFGIQMEAVFGPLMFALVYLGGIVGGNLIALLIHRSNPSYSSVGASGAINAVIFAAITLFPSMQILFLPGWIFGLLFILFSIYGIRSRKDNIGHESHLGGALTGMLMAVCYHPAVVMEHPFTLLLLLFPTMAFIIIIVTRPQLLMVDNYWFSHNKYNYTIDDRYNNRRRSSEQEVDRILDKINQQGIKSLSKKERDSLEEYSRR